MQVKYSEIGRNGFWGQL